MKYQNLSDQQKKEILRQEYELKKHSFNDIAEKYETYSNKIRRDAIKFKIKIRDKSQAQKNALQSGRTEHPTAGKERSQEVKNKIGMGVLQSWEELDDKTIKKRKDKARKNWESLSDDAKANILKQANDAVREASKKGSKLELFLFDQLLSDGYRVDFHKEQTLLNTKLQIDLFLPTLNVAIEVDGPSHFAPVWGADTLKRNKGYDNKKTGLILGKGMVLIRIRQLKDFSRSRAQLLYNNLKIELDKIKNKFPDTEHRNIEIGD